MMLRQHYDSYRSAVRGNCLEGFSEVAKLLKTAKPEQWPTVYDFLQETVGCIQTAIQANDEAAYRAYLREHQNCLIAVFSKMAEGVYEKSLGGSQDSSAKMLAVLDVVNKKGWNWYQFCSKAVDFQKQTWFPRYTPEFTDCWTKIGKPFFSALELGILFRSRPCPKIRDLILAEKVQGPDPTILCGVQGETFDMCPLSKVNVGVVRDWTVELFP